MISASMEKGINKPVDSFSPIVRVQINAFYADVVYPYAGT